MVYCGFWNASSCNAVFTLRLVRKQMCRDADALLLCPRLSQRAGARFPKAWVLGPYLLSELQR